MNIKSQISNRTKTYILRLVMAVALSISMGIAGAGQTLQVAANGIDERDVFSGKQITSFPFEDLNVNVTNFTTDTNGITDPTSIIYRDCNSDQGYASAWYNFTPGADINVAFDTIGSNYDTILAVWKGSPGNLTLVACNDDLSQVGNTLTSQVGIAAKAGVTYFIEVIEFAQPAGAQADTQRILNFNAYIPPGVGEYDDTDSNWSYTGSWIPYFSATDPYLYNTTHFTSGIGDKAEFAFGGTQFILTYTQAPNRGNIEVYVDGSQVAKINSNGALEFKKKYTSPIYPVGVHFVQFKNAGGTGTYIDVDAIEILSTAAPGVGVYDDADANWSYTGAAISYSGSAPYANYTTHYTTSEDEDMAAFTFSGTQFILTYTQAPNRGVIDVFVDRIQIAAINANGVLEFQKSYTSPIFPAGTHFVEFKHGGGGAYIDVDAIEILSTAAPGAGVYDDTDANWSYSEWALYNGSKPFGSTLHYNGIFGSTASFTFSGTQFVLTYTQAPNRGDMDVYLDGSRIATVNATGVLGWQQVYISPVFASGTHFVQLKHAGGGAYVDVDAIQILETTAPGVGVYDDADANWSYTGAWVAYSGGVVPYANNTVHYTTGVGDTAAFTFSGTQFVLTYTQAANRGNIGVYVDGIQVATVNATGALAFEQTYISPVFSSETHVVQFKHAGGGGAFIDVDEIEILNTAAPEVGVYDDADANWSYSAGWALYNGSGPSGDTMHYTNTVGDTATFTFSGSQFVLTYTQAANRGNIDVYVDGIQVATVNATGALAFEQTYTSPVFVSGTHLVQFKHAGGGGAFIDVDAIEILNTSVPGTGVYDDADANWSYTAGWLLYTGSGPSGNTMHYTNAVGSTAAFTFSGEQFVLTYTQAANRGNIGVFVDGIKLVTIKATGALGWQQSYTSPVFATGTHVVQFKHAGGAGTYIDLDAFEAK